MMLLNDLTARVALDDEHDVESTKGVDGSSVQSQTPSEERVFAFGHGRAVRARLEGLLRATGRESSDRRVNDVGVEWPLRSAYGEIAALCPLD